MAPILLALRRAKLPIVWIALANLLGIAAGVILVHAHYQPAVGFRDRLVGQAVQSSKILQVQSRGFPFKAALLDFTGNTCVAALPTTVMGLSVVAPLPVATARGFIGGVVSIDGNHRSRLTELREAAYYVLVLILQVIPYSLAGGVGVRLGLGFLLPRSRWGYAGSKRWIGLPAEGLLDVLRVYAVALPLFLLASMVEFLAR